MANQTSKLQKWRSFIFVLKNHRFADRRNCFLAINIFKYPNTSEKYGPHRGSNRSSTESLFTCATLPSYLNSLSLSDLMKILSPRTTLGRFSTNPGILKEKREIRFGVALQIENYS